MLKKAATYILIIIILAAALVQHAFAASNINTNAIAELEVFFHAGQTAISGASFKLYRVADVSEKQKYSLTEDFKKYAVSLEGLDNRGWSNLAETLAGYAVRDKLKAEADGKTNSDGKVKFTKQRTGLYLVVGNKSKQGGYFYTPQPFLVCLPSRDADGSWKYSVTAEPKYTREKESTSGNSAVTRRVLKVWDDNKQNRPKEITVQLIGDGKVVDTVKLNEGNSWRHDWKDLDKGTTWQVVEKETPDGYTVSVRREGSTFVVTNTALPDKPTEPKDPKDDPNEPDDPTDPKPDPDDPNKPNDPKTDPNEPNYPDDPNELPNEPNYPDDPNELPNEPNYLDEPNEPDDPNDPNNPSEPKLPQTGTLWAPVAPMALGGMLLFLLGWEMWIRRNEKDDI